LLVCVNVSLIEAYVCPVSRDIFVVDLRLSAQVVCKRTVTFTFSSG
jgi:hypothetical protein